MNRRLLLMLVVIGFFLSSCTLAPKYEQPKPPVPDEWPKNSALKGAQAESDALKIQAISTQAFIPDAKLQKVIGISLENNRDLRLAALNVERMRALYGIQRAELAPALTGTGSWGKERRSAHLISTGEPRTVEQYSVGLGVAAWEVDFFGRIRSLKNQALEEYLATDAARRSAQLAIVSEIVSTYLTLGADRENLRLARSTLEAQQTAYDLIKRQYDVGVATELDLRRAQIPVDSAQGDIARYLQLVGQDQNALNLLAGSTVPEELLPDDLDSVAPFKEIFAGMPSEVLLNRPDIIAAEHRLKGAYAFIGAARAAFFPRIALTSSIGTASTELSELFSSSTGTWSFGSAISLPIFDARVWAAYRVSKAQREIILTEYEKTIQVAFREVADALAVKGTVDQQLSSQKSLTNAAEETYRLSRERYSKGIDSYLGVLDAQQSMYAAEQGLISVRLAKLINQVRFYSVLGGGSESPE